VIVAGSALSSQRAESAVQRIEGLGELLGGIGQNLRGEIVGLG